MMMYRNTTQTSFEGDLKVLKRSKLCRNHEYSSLLQAIERFQQELKLSSLQCKDRNQLNEQWEDQQFYRILVRMMHEVAITTGVKQKDDLKKVYQWYQTNKSVLHSQPHFKAAASKEIYKRPVLQFSPEVVKYYSTPHDKRRTKQVAFDGDGKAKKRTRSSHGRVKEEGLEGAERGDQRPVTAPAGLNRPKVSSKEGCLEGAERGDQRPVTAPAGLNRPKVTNSLPRSPESSRPGSGHDDPSIAARFIRDQLSASQDVMHTMHRPSSAQELDSSSADLKTTIDPDHYLNSEQSNHRPCVAAASHTNDQSESLKTNQDSPKELPYSQRSPDRKPEAATMLNYKHPIVSLVNPIAWVQHEDDVYGGGQTPDERSKSPIKIQMHVDIPVDGPRELHQQTADDKKSENLGKWLAFQEGQDYGQDVMAQQSFYGHGGLATNVRYTSHDGGERPEYYTQDIIASYAEEAVMSSPQACYQSADAINSTTLEEFYDHTESHSPQPRSSSRSGKYPDMNGNKSSIWRSQTPDEINGHARNGVSLGSNREKTVKFESVVDLVDQVGDQLTLLREKLTPDPRPGYRQPMLRITPVQPRPQSATKHPVAPSLSAEPGSALAESSKVLNAPPNSSRQSTCSSTDFTPRNKKGDPIILLPDASQYMMHLRKKDRSDTASNMTHANSSQGRVVPDQNSRARSAPGKPSLRSAGSTSAGFRPRTATEQSARHRWGSTTKFSDCKQRIPQAASHNTMSINSQTLASMVVVNHLGNDHRNSRSRMGCHGYYLDQDFEPSMPAMEYMSITGPARFTSRGQGDKAVSIPTDETYSSDITAYLPLSQTSPLESLPSQEYLHRQGSSNGMPEGTSDGPGQCLYADSLDAGSERTDEASLSQDLGDLDDDLNRSQNSQDLGSEFQSSDEGTLNLEPDNSSCLQKNVDVESDLVSQDVNSAYKKNFPSNGEGSLNLELEGSSCSEENVNIERHLVSQDVNPADASNKESVVFEETAEDESKEKDSSVIGDLSSDNPVIDLVIPSIDVNETDMSLDCVGGNRIDTPPDDSVTIDNMNETSGHAVTPGKDLTDEHQDGIVGQLTGESNAETIRQVQEQNRNEHFLNDSHDQVRRPKSANPRLYNSGKDGQVYCGEKGRPVSAKDGVVPSVFAIEISGSQKSHSSKSLHTVPIAYMALSDDHRNHLQNRAVPLVDHQTPHYQPRHVVMSPTISKKPLTARASSARKSPVHSPKGSERSDSPSPSLDISHAEPMENPLCTCSPMASHSASPVMSVLQAQLDILESTGHLELTMPNLTMPMDQPLTSEGPPEPPASISGSWSSIPQEHPKPTQLAPPPEILIQRPSSAPPSRSDSSIVSSRPSSAHPGLRRPRAATERASSVINPRSAASTRPRSVSAIGQGREWKGRPLPVYGAVRDADEQTRAAQVAQEAKSSVNIKELFSGSTAKEYRKEMDRQERERLEKQLRDSKQQNRFYKEHLMRQEIALVQRPDILDRDWAREYLSDKMVKDKVRQEKWNEHMRQQSLVNKKALSYLNRIGPSVDIWEMFHGGKRGVSKAQMKKAAVTIQKYVRGWIFRTMLEKVKQKSRVHAGSFKSFVKYYAQLMKCIARWHGVRKPVIHLDLWQMDEFMDRKRYYEYVFAKRAHPNDSMGIGDLDGFFKECDHYPSKREILNAIAGATKKDGEKLEIKLNEKEVIEVTFMIYVPPGSSLKQENTRKSTWLNPLVDGQEAKKLMGSDEVEKAEYAKSLQVVFAAFQERREQEREAKKREERRTQDEDSSGASDGLSA